MRHDEEDRRQIDDARRATRSMRVRGLVPREAGPATNAAGSRHVHALRKSTKCPRPAHGHGRRAEHVLEHQVPADDPGDEFAERRIGVGVRAARDRDHRRELRVAQASEQARENGEDERQGHGRSRRWSLPRVPVSTKMPAPMIAPMPKHRQVGGRQYAAEPPPDSPSPASACSEAMLFVEPRVRTGCDLPQRVGQIRARSARNASSARPPSRPASRRYAS